MQHRDPLADGRYRQGQSLWLGAAREAAKGPPPHGGHLSSSPASHLQAAGPRAGAGRGPATPATAPAGPGCAHPSGPGSPIHGRAHPAEPVEPAAAGAAPVSAQTGTGPAPPPHFPAPLPLSVLGWVPGAQPVPPFLHLYVGTNNRLITDVSRIPHRTSAPRTGLPPPVVCLARPLTLDTGCFLLWVNSSYKLFDGQTPSVQGWKARWPLVPLAPAPAG